MIRAALLTLILLLLAPAGAARADIPDRCPNARYIAHFDPRLTPQPCVEITTAEIRWSGHTSILRAIRPASMPITDSDVFVARIHEIAASAGAAMERMGGDLSLDPVVTIMFTNDVSPRGEGPDQGFDQEGYIAGASTTFSGECPVTYYKGGTRSTGDDFVFITVHEIFHCIQYRTWPRMVEQRWLTEGTAEYFAYLARPTYAGDNSYITRFDGSIPGVPLRDLDYSAVVFYLWLGDAHGPERVREFINGASSIEAAIAPDMWIEFGQAYFDQAIHMPNGAAAPSSPQVGGTRTISGDDTLHIPSLTPFTLNNAIFSFARDRFYEMSYDPSPEDVRMRWRKTESGAWEAPLTEISTCDGPQRYRVIWASTRSTTIGDMHVRAQPAGASMCTCPAGVWRETEGSLRHMMEQSATGSGATRFISGARVLTLNADHTGTFMYQDVITETHSSAEFWTRQTKTGGTHFTWRAVGGMLLATLTSGADNLLTLHNEIHTPGRVIREDRRAGAQSIGHLFSCDSAGLHLRQRALPAGVASYGFNVDMDFARAGRGSP